MDIDTRLSNIENLLESLVKSINDSRFYTEADIKGVRQNVGDIQQEIYPSWNKDRYPYFAGERVSYDGSYYRCIQNHTSQVDWTPDTAVSLWVSISDPSEEFPEWKQPAGAHDAYQKGDKVSHNDKHWISDIDANVYEPSVYGWSEI